MRQPAPLEAGITAAPHPDAGGLSVEEIASAETRASLILSVIPDSIPALQTLALCAMARRSIQMREACEIMHAAIREGHDNSHDLLMHLLEGADKARAALAPAQPDPGAAA